MHAFSVHGITATCAASGKLPFSLRKEEEEEEEEKGLFKADAVNEEDPERDRATQVQKTCSAALHS